MKDFNKLTKKEIKNLQNYYYLYYPKNIFTLLNNGFSYEYLKITDFKNLYTSRQYSKFFDNNPFLQKTESNKKLLAKDILLNGMYFPFYAKKMENFIQIYQGNHRVYSLMLYGKQNNIKSNFLFIYFPNFEKNISIDWYDFDFNSFKIIQKKLYIKPSEIEHLLDVLGGKMSQYFYYLNIAPNILFNNSDLFSIALKRGG